MTNKTLREQGWPSLGGQGWRSGESARLPPMWPGFDSRTQRHMCCRQSVVGSFLAPRGFSPGSPVFPSPQEPTFPNSKSIWNTRINEFLNLVPRVILAFKMAARRTPWKSAGHVSPKILEILIFYDWLIYGHVICCLPRSSPSRHFERREDPGDEVDKFLRALQCYVGI